MWSLILYEPDPEIEMTFNLRKKNQSINEQRCEAMRNSNMAGEEKTTLWDFVTPGVQGIALSIAQPAVDAKNFELNPALIFMMQ